MVFGTIARIWFCFLEGRIRYPSDPIIIRLKCTRRKYHKILVYICVACYVQLKHTQSKLKFFIKFLSVSKYVDKNENSLSKSSIGIFGIALLFYIFGCSQTGKNGTHKQINMTMDYTASFCDPLKKDIIELGDISKDSIIDKFEKTPWAEFLSSMANVKEENIY